MSDIDHPTPVRTNGAHAAMWAVGAIFLVGGVVLAVVTWNLGIAASDATTLARSLVAVYIGVGVASFGLLLLLIAWTVAAAKR